MVQLKERDPEAHARLVAVYVEGRYQNGREPLDHVNESSRLVCARGLAFVSRAMPSEIVLPGPLEEQINANGRAAEARRLKAEGLSVTEIARQLGTRTGCARALLRR